MVSTLKRGVKMESLEKKGIKISKFNKEYQFNIRERNIRDVKHLIIHNLKIQQPNQITLENY